jgi:hypothetical protein
MLKYPEKLRIFFFGTLFEKFFMYICNNQIEVMARNYFILILFLMFSLVGFAQEGKQPSEVLGFYPNPVSSGKIYITSKTSLDKEISIFDVLGKKVLQTTISSRELNIATIPPGVYIIKITEGETTATRKLIIR